MAKNKKQRKKTRIKKKEEKKDDKLEEVNVSLNVGGDDELCKWDGMGIGLLLGMMNEDG
jgi:hypothetical protein